MSISNLHLLDVLNKDKLLMETSCLRATVAPNIRQKRRVKSADSSKVYQHEHFTEEELHTGIKNVTKPEVDLFLDVNTLIKSVL